MGDDTSVQSSLSRCVERTLAVRSSLNRETAVAILYVVPPPDVERAVKRAEQRGLIVKTQRAVSVQ